MHRQDEGVDSMLQKSVPFLNEGVIQLLRILEGFRTTMNAPINLFSEITDDKSGHRKDPRFEPADTHGIFAQHAADRCLAVASVDAVEHRSHL